MRTQNAEDELLVRYLLGQLNESDAERIERDYFNDDDFYERLEAVEDELIDAYARDGLRAEEREQFEKYFLRDAERRERVEFAREWLSLISRTPGVAQPVEERARRTGWFDFLPFGKRAALIPLTAVALLALGTWLAIQTARLGRQLDQMSAERARQEKTERQLQQQVDAERRRSEQLLAELESERNRREDRSAPASSLPVIVSFILSPGLPRDAGDARRLAIPPEATQVRLWAAFKAGDYQSYRAELQTVEGRVIWSQRGLTVKPRREEKMALVTIPARRLKDEDYILVLKGVAPTGELSDVSEYSFRVVR
ncbi:MAG: hypothetical protein ACREBD_20980 [Blastocatellia bacterium]